MKIHRVVLDTNILVAGSRSRNGASFALLLALKNGQFTALASVPLMLEYEAVLKRPEQLTVSGRTEATTDAFLALHSPKSGEKCKKEALFGVI